MKDKMFYLKSEKIGEKFQSTNCLLYATALINTEVNTVDYNTDLCNYSCLSLLINHNTNHLFLLHYE